MEAIRYFLFRSLRNMASSPLLCSAAILTMGVALAAVGVFLLVVLNLQNLTKDWRDDIQVVAYMDRVPSATELDEVLQKVKTFPEVETAIFVSKTDALQRFTKRLGEDSDLLTGLRADVLPASLELQLKGEYQTRNAVQQVADRLKSELKLEDLQYGKDWLEQFESFTTLLELVGVVLGGFLVFAAVFIVSNTIKLTLYARRDELEIMTLVGATLRFIKTPFIIEGLLQGILGGVLAVGILYGLHHFVLKDGLQVLLLTPAGFTIEFLPREMQLAIGAAGAFLGVLGSLLALRRFVRI